MALYRKPEMDGLAGNFFQRRLDHFQLQHFGIGGMDIGPVEAKFQVAVVPARMKLDHFPGPVGHGTEDGRKFIHAACRGWWKNCNPGTAGSPFGET